jgi:hypothetical protein
MAILLVRHPHKRDVRLEIRFEERSWKSRRAATSAICIGSDASAERIVISSSVFSTAGK